MESGTCAPRRRPGRRLRQRVRRGAPRTVWCFPQRTRPGRFVLLCSSVSRFRGRRCPHLCSCPLPSAAPVAKTQHTFHGLEKEFLSGFTLSCRFQSPEIDLQRSPESNPLLLLRGKLRAGDNQVTYQQSARARTAGCGAGGPAFHPLELSFLIYNMKVSD